MDSDTAEQLGGDLRSLLAPEEVVDRLVSAVRDVDVAQALFWLRQLEKNTETGISAIVTAGSKEQSRASAILVRVLAAKGAKLPKIAQSSDWIEHIESWAIEMLEGGLEKENEEAERDARMLLEMSYDDAEQWCRENLPPPMRQDDEGADQLDDGYISDEALRAMSAPPAEQKPDGQQSHRSSTVDVVQGQRAGNTPGLRPPVRTSDRPVKAEPADVIDLTTSRSPSPVPKEEEVEASLADGALASPGTSPQQKKRSRSRSPDASARRNRDRAPQPEARAHLRVDNLPADFTDDDLVRLFEGVPGVIDAETHRTAETGVLWGFVSLVSIATAQHAHAMKDGTYARLNETRALQLKIYSADGQPMDPHRPVDPVTNNVNGWSQNRNPQQQQQFPHGGGAFNAAELAARVYCGSLRHGVTHEEVGSLFSGRAGVQAQLPDAITAQHAIRKLHGTMYDGHLLQIEPVNELGRRWRFSLTLHGLPLRWQYCDVSDFLIQHIGSFAGLRVNPPPMYTMSSRAELRVQVELRYETELRWAFGELNGRVVDGRQITCEVDQPWVRKKMETEIAFQNLQQSMLAGSSAAVDGEYDPHNPTGSRANAVRPAQMYEQTFPMLDGGATPGGGRRPPPPPPPPQASVDADDDVNPFAFTRLRAA
ncbi:hypothetical protein Rt10032_c04g2086 [Rhodotorula toruloides]|uniref:RRM domain-containing protein n=1 Tax=Rhodotorula toruloides TaxID=5286 RepID=A0A511KCH3_RHOTO|nr:hypothetical protein Rt10032_c04g2086 [Rhodotorula toruloides]